MVKDLRITTERLLIRPYVESDLQECFQLMQDRELFTYLDMDVMTFDEYSGLFNWLISCYDVGFDQDFKYSFNITLKETGAHIGWCGIGGSNHNHDLKEIYYLIGREYWGKGYAKEASKALLDYAFRVMGLDRVNALVRPENIASKRVIGSMGLKYRYTLQGLPAEFDWNNGELFYSLSREEYQGNDA